MRDSTPRAVQVLPVTEVPWAQVERLFTSCASRCWCQAFQLGDRWNATTPTQRRQALRTSCTPPVTDAGPGVLALVDGRPAGWCGVGPRSTYRRLVGAPVVRAAPAVNGQIWSVVCFAIPRQERGHGLMRPLLDGAVGLARDAGADVIEAYPIDPTVAGAPRNLYQGVLQVFVDAGFTEVVRRARGRTVVRLAS